MTFEQFDADKDGFVTKEEATRTMANTPATSAPAQPPAKPTTSASESPNENTSPFAFAFTRDYSPGSKDASGKFTTGTECNYIVAHDGKLFATISCWNLASTLLSGGR